MPARSAISSNVSDGAAWIARTSTPSATVFLWSKRIIYIDKAVCGPILRAISRGGSMRSRWKVIRLAIAAVLCASTTWAQQAAGISGVVRDSSNAVLPGVTVEAASPALIEKTRLVTTDGEGRYSIVDLRPGTYTVTFSLPGFSNVVRHGVELQSGFTASINATMSVGSVEESVTVTAASPVVDVQSSRQQQLVKSTELEALPAGNIGLQTLAYV